MKAILIQKYGHPEEVLKLGEAPKPTPGDKDILVRVKATTVNDYDWSLVTGKPYLYRLMFGLKKKPKQEIPGMEVAGIVEAVGKNVKNFKVGDPVFGDTSDHGFGTFAEFTCLDEGAFLHKPSELSFEEAVSLPHASALAYQSLMGLAKIQKGQKILINGAGGGVGSFGVQLAKLYGCEVTGVDSEEKHAAMTNLGYDHVIDYRKTNFTTTGERFDIVLDCKSNKPALSYLRSLKKGGLYVTVGGTPAKLIALLFWGKLIKPFTKRRLKILSLKPNANVMDVVDLIQNGKITHTIDGPHPLENSPALVQYFGMGKHTGKVVINIED